MMSSKNMEEEHFSAASQLTSYNQINQFIRIPAHDLLQSQLSKRKQEQVEAWERKPEKAVH